MDKSIVSPFLTHGVYHDIWNGKVFYVTRCKEERCKTNGHTTCDINAIYTSLKKVKSTFSGLQFCR